MTPFLLLTIGTTFAAEPAPAHVAVPYHLLMTKHLIVRVRVNGKGPFHFILDTGAPAVFVSEKLARKAGVEFEKHKFSTITNLDIEGGLRLENVKAKVENLAQLDAMNEIGLGGVELHGVLGYNVLARYRITYDLTSDRLLWTALKFDPGEPEGENGLARSGVEQLSGVIKMLSSKLGPKTTPPPLRGFLGVELKSGSGPATVAGVLDDGPAARAGVQTGDVITHWDEIPVADAAALLSRARTALPGKAVALRVRRAGASHSLNVTPSKGF